MASFSQRVFTHISRDFHRNTIPRPYVWRKQSNLTPIGKQKKIFIYLRIVKQIPFDVIIKTIVFKELTVELI